METDSIVDGFRNLGSNFDRETKLSSQADLVEIQELLKRHTQHLTKLMKAMSNQMVENFRQMVEEVRRNTTEMERTWDKEFPDLITTTTLDNSGRGRSSNRRRNRGENGGDKEMSESSTSIQKEETRNKASKGLMSILWNNLG